MTMYNPPSERHETGVEGAEIIDVEPQDAETSELVEPTLDADATDPDAEPVVTMPAPDERESAGSSPPH